MREIADGVWHIPLMFKDAVNAYLLGDVLVDAGTKGMGKKLPGRLEGRTVSAHTLTHAHPDHVGGSKPVVDALGVPFWAPKGDAPAVERGMTVAPEGRMKKVLEAGGRFGSVPIARTLSEGDEIGDGFTVLDTPGHSPGHISFWRERDRVLICGDVWFNMNVITLKPGLRAPLTLPTVDPAENARSQQKLVELQPDIAGFGHGPVMTGAAAKLRAFPA
jgi:glyoxylase-like metal-dependent hydrolase (beta-lactamase superfamily II)